MNVRLGVWAAGDTKHNDVGVVEWAGGETDFDAGPYTMTVQSVYAKDYTQGAEYSWEDMDASGSFKKVKVIAYVGCLRVRMEPSINRSQWKVGDSQRD